jgi:hypothetical protein
MSRSRETSDRDDGISGVCARRVEERGQRTRINEFADRFLRGFSSAIAAGSSLGGAHANERRAAAAAVNDVRAKVCSGDAAALSPGEAILKARREVGRISNEAYLQTGIMLLWAGDDPAEEDADHTLFPSSLGLDRDGDGALSDEALVELHTLQALEAEAGRTEEQLVQLLYGELLHRLVYFCCTPVLASWVYARTMQIMDAINSEPSSANELIEALKSAANHHKKGSSVATSDASTRDATRQERDKDQHRTYEKVRVALKSAIKALQSKSEVSSPSGNTEVRAVFMALADLTGEHAEKALDELLLDPIDTGSEWQTIISSHVNSFPGLERFQAFCNDNPGAAARQVLLGAYDDGRSMAANPTHFGDARDDPYALLRPDESHAVTDERNRYRMLSDVQARRSACSLARLLQTGSCHKPPPHITIQVDNRALPASPVYQVTNMPLQTFRRDNQSRIDELSQMALPVQAQASTMGLLRALRLKDGEGSAAVYTYSSLSSHLASRTNSHDAFVSFFSDNRNGLTPALWTPACLAARGDLPTPRVGHARVDVIGMHMATASFAAELDASLRRVIREESTEERWKANKWHWWRALLKLWALPALRTSYDTAHGGVDAQQQLSNEVDANGACTAVSMLRRAQVITTEASDVDKDPDHQRLVTYVPAFNMTLDIKPVPLGVLTMAAYRSTIAEPSASSPLPPVMSTINPKWCMEYDEEPAESASPITLHVLKSAEGMRDVGVARVPAFASMDGLGATVRATHVAMHQLSRARRNAKYFGEALQQMYGDAYDREDAKGAKGTKRSRVAPLVDDKERTRRAAIWEDALRELSVSGDRLLVFLKTMSGTLHEDVNQIIRLEDRTMEATQRQRRDQRRDERRRVDDFTQRTLGTMLQSVFGASRLRVDVDLHGDGEGGGVTGASSAGSKLAEELVVVSDDSAKRLQELMSGTNGLGALEAYQGLQQVLERARSRPMTLAEVVASMRGVLDDYRRDAMRQFDESNSERATGSLEQLAEPRNALIVRLRPEAFAAIRTAYELLTREMRHRGMAAHRIPTAYDCIEGDDMGLTNQFAVLCAYQLAHGRIFSSQQSVYVGQTPARMNQHMLRLSVQKMSLRAEEFARSGRTDGGFVSGGGNFLSPPAITSLNWRPVVGNGLSLAYPRLR